MIVDFPNRKRIDKDIQLIKTSDQKKFIKLLDQLVLQGYAVTVINMQIKVVPRIGKVITYFAELRAK